MPPRRRDAIPVVTISMLNSASSVCRSATLKAQPTIVDVPQSLPLQEHLDRIRAKGIEWVKPRVKYAPHLHLPHYSLGVDPV